MAHYDEHDELCQYISRNCRDLLTSFERGVLVRAGWEQERSRQGEDGCWSLENNYKGRTYFRLERLGAPSRWNTLRALRVLQWWEQRNNS